MHRFTLAFKLFFRVLFDKQMAERIGPAYAAAEADLDGTSRPATTVVKPTAEPTARATPAPAAAPIRSDAVTLLAVLQREARLVDFLKEQIAGYDDAQVGAAVRDVHRDAAAALERMFALRPVSDQAEGAEIPIPPTPDAARLRLVGNLTSQPPARGRLQHAGWQATKLDLPQFTGAPDAAKVIAPAEVEI
jgi:hypothetical protein